MQDPLTPFDELTPAAYPAVHAALQRAGLDAWMPEGEGKWSLPLQFMPDGGWVELMRLAPGTALPLHRHHGEVHALNLQGRRRLDDGRVIGPGEYVYEPCGNVDSWQVVGDDLLLLHVVVRGDVDYMGADGQVHRRITSDQRRADYRAFCASRGLTARLG